MAAGNTSSCVTKAGELLPFKGAAVSTRTLIAKRSFSFLWMELNQGSVNQATIRSEKTGLFEELYPHEAWWRDHYSVLKQHGYILRSRFRPGWTPSWVGTKKGAWDVEDGIPHYDRAAMDATRVSDNRQVYIKKVATNSSEVEISQFLSAPERADDPMNHCAPIIDYFIAENEPGVSFLVMPLLRRFNDPEFYTVEEVLDFMQQTLEGLVYIHEHNIAHRDLSFGNIMMNSMKMYPRGFHPYLHSMSPSLQKVANGLRRNQVPRVKYYFIDWGLSSIFTNANEEKLVMGDIAADRDVPELDSFMPYNPFLVDIFTLGNVFKKDLVNKYTNLGFLRPLAEEMTAREPKERPTAETSLRRFKELIQPVAGKERRWHLCLNPKYKPRLGPPIKPISPSYLDKCSQMRELIWQIKSTLYSLVGRELIWPVPERRSLV